MTVDVAGARPLEDEVAAFFAHDPAYLADPYPLFRRLQHEQPAFRHGDHVLLTRYQDAREVLLGAATVQGLSSDSSRYRNAAGRLEEEGRRRLGDIFGYFDNRLAGANGQHHQRLRKLAQKAFTPRLAAQMEARIQEITDELLSPMAGRSEVELVGDFAYQLPLTVVCELLDVPAGDRARLRHWTDAIGQFVGANWDDEAAVAAAHAAVGGLRAYLVPMLEARRSGTTSELLGSLLAARSEEGESFSEDELIAMVIQLVFAGHETTTNFIGNYVVFLAGEHREHWDLLRDDPSLAPAAIEELLRFTPPNHYIDKLSTIDGEIGGTPFRALDTLSVVVAAANRDPEVFEDPDAFDVLRTSPGHLTFGFGAHHCIGAALARLEATVVLRTFLRRFPDLRLATSQVDWRPNHLLRGPLRLPVTLGRDRG